MWILFLFRRGCKATSLKLDSHKGMVRSDMSKPALIFFSLQEYTQQNPLKIVATNTHCKYFLKIAEITNFSVRGTACTKCFYNPLCRLMSRPLQHSPRRIACCILLPALLGVDISPRVWQVTILAMFSNFRRYLQRVLAARTLIVDFVVCTLAVKKKKKKKSGQVSTCRIGPFPCQRQLFFQVLRLCSIEYVTIE
jgi:hypothetical protein